MESGQLTNQSTDMTQLNNNRSTDSIIPDSESHEVENHKTELVEIENRSEDIQRHVQVQPNDNYDNQRTYTTNSVSKQMSSETGESLVPVTVNSSSSQSNVTHISPVGENGNEAHEGLHRLCQKFGCCG